MLPPVPLRRAPAFFVPPVKRLIALYARFAVYALLALSAVPAGAQNYAGEVFRIGQGVASNGSARVLPSSLYPPSDLLDFPSRFPVKAAPALEASLLPLFGGLSDLYHLSGYYGISAGSQFAFWASGIWTGGIRQLPLLPGTPEDRQQNPALRPDGCPECPVLEDRVLLGGLSHVRRFRTELPRTGISSRPIPLDLRLGTAVKYFEEELVGGGYSARNLNLDLEAAVLLAWGFDPVLQSSDRDVEIRLTGFELLPTAQASDLGGSTLKEKVEPRWSAGVYWQEAFPRWRSDLTVGLLESPRLGNFPGLGLEWGFRRILFLRMGKAGPEWNAGASMALGPFACHYAFLYHPLQATLYQVSLQWGIPAVR